MENFIEKEHVLSDAQAQRLSLQCSNTFELLRQLHERNQQSLRVIRSVLTEIMIELRSQLEVPSQLRPRSGQSHQPKAADSHFSKSMLPSVYGLVCKAPIDLEGLRQDCRQAQAHRVTRQY